MNAIIYAWRQLLNFELEYYDVLRQRHETNNFTISDLINENGDGVTQAALALSCERNRG